jgi:hypothetical protein
MTIMQKMTATWTGWAGAPGTSTFWFQGASILDPVMVQQFFSAASPYLPASTRIQVAGTGELVDSTNGQVNGTWSMTQPALVSGTGAGGVPQLAMGPQIRIDTGAYRRGKHIRGRIYLIPSQSVAFDSTGMIAAATVTALTTAANALRTSSSGMWGVFHRPTYQPGTKPPVIVNQGEFIPATLVVCQAKPAVLRSRRD